MRVCFLLVSILAFLFSDAYSQTDLLKLQLRERYQGKTFLVRGFLTGEHLYYASTGAPVVNETSGDWTADGFVKVNKVQIRQQSLILEARRLVAVYIDHKFKLLPAESALGMELTSAYQLMPEQSTAAIVIHHPEAKYFSIGSARERAEGDVEAVAA